MSLTLFAIASSPLPSGSGLAVLAVVWLGTLAAAAALFLHHTSTLTKLREELDTLTRSSTPETVARPAGGSPMFGALYETGPTLLERLQARPAPALALLATVLAALGGVLLVREAGQIRAIAVDQRAEIRHALAAYDSLSTVLSGLRDTVASVRASSALAQSPRPTAPRATTSRDRHPSAPVVSRSTIPPPPALDLGSPASK